MNANERESELPGESCVNWSGRRTIESLRCH